MNEFWNKVYKSDNSFFGDDPSNFAIRCYNHLKENNSKKILDLGSGHWQRCIIFCIKWNWSRFVKLLCYCNWNTW